MKRGNAVLAVVVALAGGAAGADGQSGSGWVYQRSEAPPAWLGLTYDVEWLARAEGCESRVVVASVVEGAPAHRAGLRPGDALVSVDGEALAGGLQSLGTRLRVGEPVRLGVLRDGRRRDIVAVAGERPEQPPVVLWKEAEDGFARTDAPVIRVRADTVMARNLDAWTARQGGGYWVVSEGRTDFRRLATFSGSDLDRRVADLVLCAQRTQAVAPRPAPPAPARVLALQEKADSVRQVLVRRAMARTEPDLFHVIVPPAQAPVVSAERVAIGVAPAPPAAEAPGMHVFSFDVGDHLLAGERGVAGAELASMEPELAAYFRGVRDGLLVLRVAPGTPAARAGLEPGDVITHAGGRALNTVGELRILLTTPAPGAVELRLVRHGRDRTVTLGRS